MKKLNPIVKCYKVLLILAVSLIATISTAQVKKPFTLRYQSSINGDVIVVGNNTISRTATGNYNGSDGNHDFSDNVYVDIDNDFTTFNSSSANLTNPYPGDPCLAIDKVLLYWAAADKGLVVGNGNNTVELDNQPGWNYNQVKIMLPGQTSYTTVSADDVIFRGRDENPHFVNDAYICVKDITNNVINNSNAFGKYQVANVEGRQGYLYSHDGNNTGTSGGWQLVVVYKSDQLKRKNISFFDGYANVTSSNNNFNINFSGFQTIPTGAVKSDIVIGALEGDRDLSGDRLQMLNSSNVFEDLDAPLRNSNNFFNSRITNGNSNFTDRNPASTNTLGFDSAHFNLDNSGNNLLQNNQTSTTLRLTSNQEAYGLYLLGLAVEVYEPKLDPIVYTATPNTITPNSNPQTVTYNASTTNNGNDDATNISFVTTVPIGSELVQPVTGLPSGLTYSYNSSTRELTFAAADGLLDVGETLSFAFDVTVNDQCYYLENGCSTTLSSQLSASYTGFINNHNTNIVSSNSLDECKQGNNLSTTVTINPPAPATWVTTPNELDVTIEYNDITALNNAQALAPVASCNNLIPVKTSGNFIPDSSCPSVGTITNTWNFTDACGNIIEDYTQVITLIDTTSPIISVPSEIIIEGCSASDITSSNAVFNFNEFGSNDVQNIFSSNNNYNASDDYNIENITYNDVISSTNDCPIIVTRTFTVTDTCNNSATATQTITIQDTTPPVISVPDDITIECGQNIPPISDVIQNESIINSNNFSVVNDEYSVSAWFKSNNNNYEPRNFAIPNNNLGFGVEGNISGASGELGANSTGTEVIRVDFNVPQLYINVTFGWKNSNEDTYLTFYLNNQQVGTTKRHYGGNDSVYNPILFTTDNGEAFDRVEFSAPYALNDSDHDYLIHSLKFKKVAAEIEAATGTDSCGLVTISGSDSETTSCGNTKTVIRTWTATDMCGNSVSANQTITVVDTTAPTFTAPDDIEIFVDASCNYDASVTQTGDVTDEADNCSTSLDATFTDVVTAGTCEGSFIITRTWSLTDDCGNTAADQIQTITVTDNTAPTFTAPADIEIFTDASCNYDASVTQTGDVTDETDNCSASLDATFTDVVTAGTCEGLFIITRTWSLTDDCGNTAADQIQTITVTDNISPDISSCDVKDTILECNGNDNETIATTWNTTNINELTSCATDNCSSNLTVTSDFDFNNFVNSCGLGSTITVNYTVADDCGNMESTSATLTLSDTTGPDLSTCSIADTDVDCTASDNQTIADQWNADNIAALQACASDSCATDITVTSDYDYNNLNTVCGPCGNITVTYTVTDQCNNSSTISATLNFGDATGPDLSACTVTDQTLQCDGDNNQTIADTWNNDNIAALQACANDISVVISSNYDYNNFDSSTVCGLGGTLPVTYTATDACGNVTTLSASLTIEDTTAPDLALCSDVSDDTTECDGNNNSTLASDWNAANIAALQTCPTDSCDADASYTVTSDFDFNNFVSACGLGGTITVNYTVADDCGNIASTSATLTIEDTTAPDLALCSDVSDETIECDGANNSTLASDWNAANIAALQTCPTDSCDADASYTVTSDFDFNNFVSACGLGGTITVNYTVADDCGNIASTSATLTIEDTVGPTLVSQLDLPSDVVCSNIPEVPELTFEDNCSNQEIEFTFEETSTYTGEEEMYTITWIWTATDECGNSTVITHNINVITENFIEESFISRCYEDGEIDLYNELPLGYDTDMEWTVETNGISIANGIFDPLDVDLGDYVFTYTTIDNGCLKTFRLTVNINEDCVVLPCGSLDRIKISKAVTPNGDGYNETFNVTGASDCGFVVEVKLFNRFGDVVYESDNYQNDWSGVSPSSSIGSAGRLPNGTYYYVVVLKESGLDPIAGPIYLGSK
ncbi:gliding motility-associated C-terminal domain-containing protein [Mesoflavibacter zeaxanthinifaciens]|uniref:gliding motility-associated C-terminal domain-containing protein n=1 Tax=Mesoflavibacter zeaxanthinifaciens TaxID=393060 RepID=UPI0026F134E5|nr:gliding motility-associated C-terminal domain-containing protein [Mesoflavibacter zeaxanthinifaciens]